MILDHAQNDRTSQLSSPRVPHLPSSTPAPFSWSCLPESEESETIPITAEALAVMAHEFLG